MLLTGAQREAQRQPLPVHHGMDLGRQPTSGTSRAVADMSANAGPILMHADHGAVDHPQAGFFETGKGLEEAIPDAGASPADEAIVTSRVGSEAIGQVAPWRAGAHTQSIPLYKYAVVHPRHAARLVRKERLDGSHSASDNPWRMLEAPFEELESRDHLVLNHVASPHKADARPDLLDDRVCEGFRMPAGRDVASSTEGRRPKAAREGTRGGRAGRWGLWGFDGCRRSGAAQGTGLMAARERLVGGAIATGVAQSAVMRAQAGRCRCDWRSGA